jgi:hypothetical protein
MSTSKEEKNKALALEAFDTLFNKRDYSAAERYWSADYIQHSAHTPPRRDGLFNLIKASPPSLKCEHGLITAEGVIQDEATQAQSKSGNPMFGDEFPKGSGSRLLR